MKLVVLILLLVGVTLAFRGNQNRGTILGSGSSQSSSQLNIGLIAPHTSFGEFTNRLKPSSSVQMWNFQHYKNNYVTSRCRYRDENFSPMPQTVFRLTSPPPQFSLRCYHINIVFPLSIKIISFCSFLSFSQRFLDLIKLELFKKIWFLRKQQKL